MERGGSLLKGENAAKMLAQESESIKPNVEFGVACGWWGFYYLRNFVVGCGAQKLQLAAAAVASEEALSSSSLCPPQQADKKA